MKRNKVIPLITALVLALPIAAPAWADEVRVASPDAPVAAAVDAGASASASPAAGDASASASAEPTEAPAVELAAPQNVAGERRGSQFILTWDAVPGAEGYEVEVNGKTTDVHAQREYSHTVSAEGEYALRVRAYREDIRSPWSTFLYKSPHDSMRDAQTLSVGTPVQGTLMTAGQTAWYEMNPSIQGSLTVTLTGMGQGQSFEVTLCDKDGNAVRRGTKDGKAVTIGPVGSLRTTYYITVWYAAGTGSGGYQLTAQVASYQSGDVPESVASEGKKLMDSKKGYEPPLPLEPFRPDLGGLTGTFDGETAAKWYKINAGSISRAATLTLEGGTGMALYHKTAGEVASGSSITHCFEMDADYYLGVYGPPDGEYTVGVSVGDDDLKFTPQDGVTYIFCNNHETIRKENVVNLTDAELSGRSWLMSLRDLPPGRYVLFASHNNETMYDTYASNTNNFKAFDIFVDVLFTRYGGAGVTIDNYGYWGGDGELASWSAMQAWADYLGEDILELAHGREELRGQMTVYRPDLPYYASGAAAKPLVFDNHGQAWLGSCYAEAPVSTAPSMPVFLMAAFTVTGDGNASVDLDIGALRAMNGSLAKSQRVLGQVAPGAFVPDWQIKGVTPSAPLVETTLRYTIDEGDSRLPVTLFNEKNPLGNPRDTEFITYGVPRSDSYGYGGNYAQNDILPFTYTGPDGKEQVFDTQTPFDTGSQRIYNLGNYGVTTRYRLEIDNIGDVDKLFVYRMTTASNYLVRLRSNTLVSPSNPMGEFTYNGFGTAARGEVLYPSGGSRKSDIDIMTCPVPAGQSTTIILEVTSPTNVTGSLENQFLLWNQ